MRFRVSNISFISWNDASLSLPSSNHERNCVFSSPVQVPWRYRTINYLEHLKVKAGYEAREMIDQQIREAAFFQSPEQLLIRQEQLDRVRQEIDKLPEKSREVFKMAYYEEKKAAEIAEELKLSVRTVETQIYKALKTLRTAFYQPKP